MKAIYGLSLAVLLLAVMTLYLLFSAPRLGKHDPYEAVNLSTGPIIRTYEIGKVYKAQLLKALQTNPDAMIGVSARDLLVVFGNSDFIRHEGRTTLWQYKNDRCVLDIFFELREGKAEEVAPAAYYEARPASDDGKSFDKVRCVADLLKGHTGLYMVGVENFYKAVMEQAP